MSEPELENDYLHQGVDCAYCDMPIEEEADGVSTPQGSMHGQCAVEHQAENPEEW